MPQSVHYRRRCVVAMFHIVTEVLLRWRSENPPRRLRTSDPSTAAFKLAPMPIVGIPTHTPSRSPHAGRRGSASARVGSHPSAELAPFYLIEHVFDRRAWPSRSNSCELVRVGITGDCETCPANQEFQHDLRPQRQGLRRLRPPRPPGQLVRLRIRQHNSRLEWGIWTLARGGGSPGMLTGGRAGGSAPVS